MYKHIFKEIDDLEAFLNRDEVKLIIGKNYDFYKELWLQHEQKFKGERKKIQIEGRWNWLAILYIPAWYGYRKLHSMYWVLLCMFSALFFYESYYNTELLKSTSGIFLVLALMSRSTYLQTIVARVKAYDKLPNKERKEQFLKKYGGESTLLAWLYGIGYIVILLATGITAAYLGGHIESPL